MEKILCVTYPGKNKVNVVYGEEIKTKCPWATTSLESKKTPTGLPLKACDWHSRDIKGDQENCENCDVKTPADYSIWVSGYICYDTCNIVNDINKKIEAEENNKIEKLINNFGKWFNSAVDLHQMFYSEYFKREEVKNEITRLEKKLDVLSKGVNNNDCVYIGLLEMQKRTKETLNNKITNMTNIYNNSKIKNEDMQGFVDKHCSEEILNYQKAKSDLQRWYNSNSNIDTKELVYKILMLRKSQDTITASLNNTYKMPFSYLYKAKENIDNIMRFLKQYQLNRNYTYEEAIDDSILVRKYLSVYSSFIEGKNINNIVEEVEREQIKAAQEEKDLKLNKSVKKISNNSNAIVVKLDGTVERNVNDEQIMIGSIVNQGDWRNESMGKSSVNINTVENNFVVKSDDDNKWKSLRG